MNEDSETYMMVSRTACTNVDGTSPAVQRITVSSSMYDRSGGV